jgi:hypothetical protein
VYLRGVREREPAREALAAGQANEKRHAACARAGLRWQSCRHRRTRLYHLPKDTSVTMGYDLAD